MRIHLIRHGHDGDGFRGGWSQFGLTPQGRTQARALAARLKSEGWQIDTLLSSDLPRALETAQALDLPIITAPQWREVNNGLLAGMASVEVDRRYPGLYWDRLAPDQRYPGDGDSHNTFFERVAAALTQLTADLEAGRIGPNVAVVTHGGVIRAVCAIVSGTGWSGALKEFPSAHTGIYTLERQAGQWVITRRNDHAHLTEETRDLVEVVDYDPRWPVAYEDEQRRIARALGTDRIEHVGSTAIPSMAAKPVIDILVGVDQLALTAEQVAAMERLGYEYRGERSGVAGRLLFRKGNPRTHHVHVVEYGGEEWTSHVLFRDWMRTHPTDAARYAALKRELAETCRHQRAVYTESKHPFITEIVAKARAATRTAPDIDVHLGGAQFSVRGGAIFLHEGHVLLHKSEVDELWCLPGGRARVMESSAETVRREIAEELGADVEVGPLQWVLENFFEYGGRTSHELGLYHLATFRDPAWYDLTRDQEGCENGVLKLTFRWFPISQIETLQGLKPKVLYQALKQLPCGLTHIANSDL